MPTAVGLLRPTAHVHTVVDGRARCSRVSSPAVANGVVYVTSDDGTLSAFDAAGVTSCSGIPTTCTPLWTAHIGNDNFPSPAIVNGVLYVASVGDTRWQRNPCCLRRSRGHGMQRISEDMHAPVDRRSRVRPHTHLTRRCQRHGLYGDRSRLTHGLRRSRQRGLFRRPEGLCAQMDRPARRSHVFVRRRSERDGVHQHPVRQTRGLRRRRQHGMLRNTEGLLTVVDRDARRRVGLVARSSARRRLRRCKRRQALCVRRIREYRMHRCTEDLYTILDGPNDGGFTR